MNAHKTKSKAPFSSLSDLNIVSPELSERILSQLTVGTQAIRESYIHRYSNSLAEFSAACEMTETLGLAVY